MEEKIYPYRGLLLSISDDGKLYYIYKITPITRSRATIAQGYSNQVGYYTIEEIKKKVDLILGEIANENNA